MTVTVAVANQKGGCAKTTTVVNLAAAVAGQGKKVLVVDLDPQANASQWLGAEGTADGSLALLTSDKKFSELVQRTNTENVSVVAGSREIAYLDKLLAGEVAVESKLRRRLVKGDLASIDYVLIDTPPTLSLITLNALTAADTLLIPVTTHVMTLSGVAQLIQTYEEVRDLLNPNLSILGLLACRVDLRTNHSKEILESLLDRFGELVLKAQIRESVSVAEAPSFQQSVMSYKSKSGVAADFRMLAIEVINRLPS